MNRADRSGHEDPAQPPLDSPAFGVPASGTAAAPATTTASTINPPPAPAVSTAGDASPVSGRPDAELAALLRIRRKPVRIVGAPPDPATAREPAEVLLRALPVAGVNRRRVGWLVGIAISAWIVAVFARQVGEASAAATRADVVRADNATLAAEVAGLQHERDVVQQRPFIEFQARAYGLGNAQDRRFSLAQNAPPLASNAPGSASVRLIADPPAQSPLDSWLSALFGPSRKVTR